MCIVCVCSGVDSSFRLVIIRDHSPLLSLARQVTPEIGRIHTVVEGECPSLEYRVKFVTDDGAGTVNRISPWHDVPYKNTEDGSYNMVVEIPKWTRAKFEIATGELCKT
jgi:hypothetical protein